jgi:uncharacterized cupredoxin-like copper-binding protein
MRLTLLGILLGGLLLAAACGGDDNEKSTVTATRATSGASGSASAATQINVAMQEYSINPEKTSTQGGKITFNVENKGPNEAHEFLVFKTDLALDKLPTQSDGSLDEEDPALEMIDEITEFNPGQKKSLTVDLEPGKYVLACNVGEETSGQAVRHFAQGMFTAFTVE